MSDKKISCKTDQSSPYPAVPLFKPVETYRQACLEYANAWQHHETTRSLYRSSNAPLGMMTLARLAMDLAASTLDTATRELRTAMEVPETAMEALSKAAQALREAYVEGTLYETECHDLWDALDTALVAIVTTTEDKGTDLPGTCRQPLRPCNKPTPTPTDRYETFFDADRGFWRAQVGHVRDPWVIAEFYSTGHGEAHARAFVAALNHPQDENVREAKAASALQTAPDLLECSPTVEQTLIKAALAVYHGMECNDGGKLLRKALDEQLVPAVNALFAKRDRKPGMTRTDPPAPCSKRDLASLDRVCRDIDKLPKGDGGTSIVLEDNLWHIVTAALRSYLHPAPKVAPSADRADSRCPLVRAGDEDCCVYLAPPELGEPCPYCASLAAVPAEEVANVLDTVVASLTAFSGWPDWVKSKDGMTPEVILARTVEVLESEARSVKRAADGYRARIPTPNPVERLRAAWRKATNTGYLPEQVTRVFREILGPLDADPTPTHDLRIEFDGAATGKDRLKVFKDEVEQELVPSPKIMSEAEWAVLKAAEYYWEACKVVKHPDDDGDEDNLFYYQRAARVERKSARKNLKRAVAALHKAR